MRFFIGIILTNKLTNMLTNVTIFSKNAKKCYFNCKIVINIYVNKRKDGGK